MKTGLILFLVFAFMLACAKKRDDFAVAHRYTLTGKIVSLNAKDQTASIAAAAIPGYMDAMTMDYPIKSKSDFDSLHVGETIKATLNLSADNDQYDLTDIHNQDTGKK